MTNQAKFFTDETLKLRPIHTKTEALIFTSPGEEFFRIVKDGRILRNGKDITNDAEALAEGLRQYAKAITCR